MCTDGQLRSTQVPHSNNNSIGLRILWNFTHCGIHFYSVHGTWSDSVPHKTEERLCLSSSDYICGKPWGSLVAVTIHWVWFCLYLLGWEVRPLSSISGTPRLPKETSIHQSRGKSAIQVLYSTRHASTVQSSATTESLCTIVFWKCFGLHCLPFSYSALCTYSLFVIF